MSDKPVRVDLEGCSCEGTPHHHDWVDLRADPSVAMGAAVTQAISMVGNDRVRLQAELGRIYLATSIVAWSFVEGDPSEGEQTPVPVSDWSPVIDRMLPWERGGMQVAEVADELYSERILSPLLSRLSMSLPGGQMVGSTSPTPSNGSTPQKHSGRSSRCSSGAGRPSVGRGRSRGKRPTSPCR